MDEASEHSASLESRVVKEDNRHVQLDMLSLSFIRVRRWAPKLFGNLDISGRIQKLGALNSLHSRMMLFLHKDQQISLNDRQQRAAHPLPQLVAFRSYQS